MSQSHSHRHPEISISINLIYFIFHIKKYTKISDNTQLDNQREEQEKKHLKQTQAQFTVGNNIQFNKWIVRKVILPSRLLPFAIYNAYLCQLISD